MDLSSTNISSTREMPSSISSVPEFTNAVMLASGKVSLAALMAGMVSRTSPMWRSLMMRIFFIFLNSVNLNTVIRVRYT